MYPEQELFEQPLIDFDQWGLLQNELGLEMLRGFACEFFEETRQSWFVQDFNPLNMEEKIFRSLAHRSAGAAGTIGFKRLQFGFLCMERNAFGEQVPQYLHAMNHVFQTTQQWVQVQ